MAEPLWQAAHRLTKARSDLLQGTCTQMSDFPELSDSSQVKFAWLLPLQSLETAGNSIRISKTRLHLLKLRRPVAEDDDLL